jgi:DNA-binding GntR family transcriptional regulator
MSIWTFYVLQLRCTKLYFTIPVDLHLEQRYLYAVKKTAEQTMLSDEEKKVYEALTRAIERDGFGPTLREIGADAGFSHEYVRAHLISLEKKGFIQRLPFRTRAIKILRRPDEAKAAA